MRLQRVTTAEHLLQLRAYLKRRSEGRRHRLLEYGTYYGVAILAVLALIGTVFAWSPTMSFRWFAAAPVVALLCWHPIWLWLDRRTDRAFVKGNQPQLGRQEFWIDETGFGNSTPAGSTFHVWSTIAAVEDTAAFGFVQSPGHLYVVPKDVQEPEASAFMTELLRRWQSGKGAVEQGDAPARALI